MIVRSSWRKGGTCGKKVYQLFRYLCVRKQFWLLFVLPVAIVGLVSFHFLSETTEINQLGTYASSHPGPFYGRKEIAKEKDGKRTVLVSAIVPFICKKCPLVEETFRSLETQTLFPLMDVIIVASKEDQSCCAEVFSKYLKLDGFFRIVGESHPRRLSPPEARNAGVKASSAPFVVMLDADDLMEPTAVEKLFFTLVTSPLAVALASGDRIFFYPNGNVHHFAQSGSFDKGASFLYYNYGHSNNMIRRSSYLRVGGNNEEYKEGLEDWEFYFRLANASLGATTIHDPLAWYRERYRPKGEWSKIDNEKKEREKFREVYHELWSGAKAWPRPTILSRSSLEAPIFPFCGRPAFLELLSDGVEATIDSQKSCLALSSSEKAKETVTCAFAADINTITRWTASAHSTVSNVLELSTTSSSRIPLYPSIVQQRLALRILYIAQKSSPEALKRAAELCEALRNEEGLLPGEETSFTFVALEEMAWHAAWAEHLLRRKAVTYFSRLRRCTLDVHLLSRFLVHEADRSLYLWHLKAMRRASVTVVDEVSCENDCSAKKHAAIINPTGKRVQLRGIEINQSLVLVSGTETVQAKEKGRMTEKLTCENEPNLIECIREAVVVENSSGTFPSNITVEQVQEPLSWLLHNERPTGPFVASPFLTSKVPYGLEDPKGGTL